MKESKVKNKKVVKRRLRLKGVFILASVFIILFFLLKALVKVDISSITVSGNEYLKDSEVIKEAGLNEDVAYFGFSRKSVCSKLESNPLIKTCKIKRTLDFKIEILIEENIPLFYYTSEAKMILSDGTRVDGNREAGIPTMINYVPEDILIEFTSRLSEIKSDIIRSISEIEYTPSASEDGTYIDEERFMMIMNDGNTVYINNKRMNVLGYYDKIYASIGDRKGVYNFDCDFDNYLFKEYGDEDELQQSDGGSD